MGSREAARHRIGPHAQHTCLHAPLLRVAHLHISRVPFEGVVDQDDGLCGEAEVGEVRRCCNRTSLSWKAPRLDGFFLFYLYCASVRIPHHVCLQAGRWARRAGVI